ncbi:MAG: hypothetical protein O7H40_09160 [Gammaproteobacteria bacterium]|nr:hypothetical protein [Gammaproteobacteria bacterium]
MSGSDFWQGHRLGRTGIGKRMVLTDGTEPDNPDPDLIRRDLPFYDASISPDFVSGMNRFARDIGILETDIPCEQIVGTRFSGLWCG